MNAAPNTVFSLFLDNGMLVRSGSHAIWNGRIEPIQEINPNL
jgi:hypothetical protein